MRWQYRACDLLATVRAHSPLLNLGLFFLLNGSFQSLVDGATIKNIQRNISLIWYSTVCLKYELLSSVSAFLCLLRQASINQRGCTNYLAIGQEDFEGSVRPQNKKCGPYLRYLSGPPFLKLKTKPKKAINVRGMTGQSSSARVPPPAQHSRCDIYKSFTFTLVQFSKHSLLEQNKRP